MNPVRNSKTNTNMLNAVRNPMGAEHSTKREISNGMNRKRSVILTVCALFAALAFAGCYQPVDYPVIVEVPQPPSATVPLVHRYIAGTSIENRPIECLVLGQGRDVTFILAAIHGNEPAGIPLVRRLAQYLQQYPHLLQGRKVVLLPVANPDGVAHNSRYNARGVDLNRNFSTANRINSRRFGRTALSEPEARAIEQLVRQYAPDRVVSIHQPLACIDYDGPGKALARRLAEYCNLPLIKLGPKPGSLGSYAGATLRIPTITLELPHTGDRPNSERLWRRYGPALIAAVVYPNRVK
ncbi:Murein peptide amidase A [subsurface metagenome]